MLKRSLYLLSLVLLFSTATLANSQVQYRVLYSFGANGPSDGNSPRGKLLSDKLGNLYGTTYSGGSAGLGTVFELAPAQNGLWTETVIYNFCSQANCSDGGNPSAGLIMDQLGNLYGTTEVGGYNGQVCCWGTVFELSPPSSPGAAWTESVLYTFGGNTTDDGCYPEGKLTFDGAGNLYGTTSQCGRGHYGAGSVFELTPSGNGGWNEIVLYNFCASGHGGCPEGGRPVAGVAFDQVGNLYGTTSAGGPSKGGVVYELSPSLGGGWTETVLHPFGSGVYGSGPRSSINFDKLGNLYGTAYTGGLSSEACDFGCGTVFRLVTTSGGWKYSAFRFTGPNGGNPAAGVLMDNKNTTMYGTTQFGGSGGTVFKIHGKTETALYNFCSQSACADGSEPATALISDTSGHLYGSTTRGGAYGQGVVFEITP
jgi:uncharacterized repeat protein (TIGR03803 family)